jgi:hypothetical protein
MSNTHDWGRFTVRINVNAPIEKLYHAWVTRSGMEYWFLRISEYKKPGGLLRGNDEFVSKGDSYKWLWYGYPDETAEYGRYWIATEKIFLNSVLEKPVIAR